MDRPGSRGVAGAASRDNRGADEGGRQSPILSRVQVLTRLLSILLSVNLAMSLYQLPLNRVIERRLCNDHYYKKGASKPGMVPVGGGDVAEDLCKIDEVQQDLARIQQIMDIAWILGDMMMTIPMGFLAEKYGQRAILLLNLIPRMAMLGWAVAVNHFDDWLPAWAIVLAPFLSILGGDCVLNSILYALASNITDEPVDRAKYFGYMTSVTYVVNLSGPTLASLAMGIRLWLPFVIGIALLGHAVRFIYQLPEERHPGLRHHACTEEEAGGLLDPESPHDRETMARSGHRHPAASGNLHSIILALRDTFSAINLRFRVLRAVSGSRQRNLSLLLLSMFLTSMASADTKLLVQYISKRYGTTFATAGYMLSCKAVGNFVLLAFAIPALLEARRRRERHRRPERGRSLSRDGSPSGDRSPDVGRRTRQDALNCLGVSVAGALAVGVAGAIWLLIPSLLLYAMGSALPVFTYSLLKSPQVWPSTPAAPQLPPAGPPSRGCDEDGGPAAGGGGGGGGSGAESHETTVFSIVMLVKTAGSLVGVPIVTSVWIRGIGLGGSSLGLPYLVSAALYATATAVVAAIAIDD
ncbi:hypothetical protein RB595_006190 [Gaeumannomyces hyphopodioides]